MAFNPPNYNYGNSGGAFFGIIGQAMANQFRQTPAAAFGQDLVTQKRRQRHSDAQMERRIEASTIASMRDYALGVHKEQLAGNIPSMSWLDQDKYQGANIPVHELNLPLISGVDASKFEEQFGDIPMVIRVPDMAAMQEHILDDTPWSGPKTLENLTGRDHQTLTATGGPNSPYWSDIIVDENILETTILGIESIDATVARQMEAAKEEQGYLTIGELNAWAEAIDNVEISKRLKIANDQLAINWNTLYLEQQRLDIAVANDFGHRYETVSAGGAHLGAVPVAQQGWFARAQKWHTDRKKQGGAANVGALAAWLVQQGLPMTSEIEGEISAQQIANDFFSYEYKSNPPALGGAGSRTGAFNEELMGDWLRKLNTSSNAEELNLSNATGIVRAVTSFERHYAGMPEEMQGDIDEQRKALSDYFKNTYGVDFDWKNLDNSIGNLAGANTDFASALSYWVKGTYRTPGQLMQQLRFWLASGGNPEAVMPPEILQAYQELLTVTGARWQAGWEGRYGASVLMLLTEAANHAHRGQPLGPGLRALMEDPEGEENAEAQSRDEPVYQMVGNPWEFMGDGILGSVINIDAASGVSSSIPQTYSVGEMDEITATVHPEANRQLADMITAGMTQPEILEEADAGVALWRMWASRLEAAISPMGQEDPAYLLGRILVDAREKSEERWADLAEDDPEVIRGQEDLAITTQAFLTEGTPEERAQYALRWLASFQRMNEILYNYAMSGKLQLEQAAESTEAAERARSRPSATAGVSTIGEYPGTSVYQ